MKVFYFIIITLFFLHLSDCTSMHSTSCNLCTKNGAKIGTKKRKRKKKRSSGSDFVVLFTSAGRDAVARVPRVTLISRTSERGQVSLPPPSSLFLSPSNPLSRNLPFHFFVDKCARAVRGRARGISCRPSHKARILLQEDSNSAHTVGPLPRGGGRKERGRPG